MKLYEICEELRDFQFDIDEETGEIMNAEYLDQLNMNFEKKVENIALFIKNLKADAEAIKAEKKAYDERQKRVEAKIKSLSGYLQRNLNGKEFHSIKCDVVYRKSTSVECDDMSKVPKKYLRYGKPSLDKTAIKLAIAAGNKRTGCRVEEHINMNIK